MTGKVNISFDNQTVNVYFKYVDTILVNSSNNFLISKNKLGFAYPLNFPKKYSNG